MIPDGTPAAEVVIVVIVATLIITGLLAALFWFTLPPKGEPPIMSTPPKPAPPTGGTEPVHVPVPDTGIGPHTSGAPIGGTGGGLPDIDAESDAWEPPRLSRRLSDKETLALLAVQRRPDGKYRHSANAIAALVGGSRNDVLAQVRAIRSGAPEVEPIYVPLDEEHRSAGVAGK